MIRMTWADLKAIMDTMHELKSDLARNRDRVLKSEGLVSRCRAVIEVWESEPLDGVTMMTWRASLHDEVSNLKETVEDFVKRP